LSSWSARTPGSEILSSRADRRLAGLAKAADSPYLEKFPEDKKDLFKYDLIVLGDVDSRIFSFRDLRR